MTPNDLLYSPLSQENPQVLGIHGLPCSDGDIIQYLLHLYRTDCSPRQLLVAMENLSEVWEKVGNSCEYKGETWPHRTMQQRNAELERRNHELYEQWKNHDEETPAVIPADAADYGFSE